MKRLSALDKLSLSTVLLTASFKEEPWEGLRVAERVSNEGRRSKASFDPELLRGREKLNEGRGSDSLAESSDMADSEGDIGWDSGLSGVDAALPLEKERLPSPGPPLSSSALSMTDRILAMLRAVLGGNGDFGGASPV